MLTLGEYREQRMGNPNGAKAANTGIAIPTEDVDGAHPFVPVRALTSLPIGGCRPGHTWA